MRQQYKRTVNVILVNHPEQATSPNTVFEVAEMLNMRNVETYLPFRPTASNVTTNVTVTTKAASSGRCMLSNFIVIAVTVTLLKLISIIM